MALPPFGPFGQSQRFTHRRHLPAGGHGTCANVAIRTRVNPPALARGKLGLRLRRVVASIGWSATPSQPLRAGGDRATHVMRVRWQGMYQARSSPLL